MEPNKKTEEWSHKNDSLFQFNVKCIIFNRKLHLFMQKCHVERQYNVSKVPPLYKVKNNSLNTTPPKKGHSFLLVSTTHF